jgi:UDP-N-acetylmuramoylalanine--D-glutamate ligase
MDRIKEYLQDFENILLLGFGQEGKSSYKFIRHLFPEKSISIADQDEGLCQKNQELNSDRNSIFVAGKNYLHNLSSFDLVIKSPGIRLNDEQRKSIKNLSSQTDIFLRFFKKQCIGITGTKGKSTTAALIAHILEVNKIDCQLIGNIGRPAFDSIRMINKNTWCVFELSAHQLFEVSYSPHISILLNLFEEHLDYYKSAAEYFGAKANIFNFQDEDDLAISWQDQAETTREYCNRDFSGQALFFFDRLLVENGIFRDGQEIIEKTNNQTSIVGNIESSWKLKGNHNILNLLAALLALKETGLKYESIFKGIDSFKGLEHRMEYVGCFDGVHYYNDSIATIPEATIAALNSIENVKTIILGGFDRGLNYLALVDFLVQSNIENIIFMGGAGKRMHTYFSSKKTIGINLLLVNNMMEAVIMVKKHTQKGKTSLLSPAAASYDQFNNFEDRGRLYKKLAEQ